MAGKRARRRPKFLPNPTEQQRAELVTLYRARMLDIEQASATRERRIAAQTEALAALAVWREAIAEECEAARRTVAHCTELARIVGGVTSGSASTADEERDRLEVFDLGVGFIRGEIAKYGRNEIAMVKEPAAQLHSEADSFLGDDDIAKVVSGFDDERATDYVGGVRVTLTKLRKRRRAWPVEG